jgi:hypothetical protein
MKRYCPVCFREISTNANGKICRHGFRKNRWIFDGPPELEDTGYRKVDSSPCRGTGKVGFTLTQIESENDGMHK